MSLIKQAEELEFVPKQQLIQMAQNPRGDYPPFLVISEIERRKQNERAFEAQQAKANMPTTTVAEESVMEFAGRGIAPSEPMLMASGGITQMQVGGQTEQEILRNQFLQSQGIDRTALAKSFSNSDDEQISDALFRFLYGEEFGDEIMDYIASVPVGGVGVQLARKGLPLIGQGIKKSAKFFRGPKKNPSGRLTTEEAYGGAGFRNIIQPITKNPVTSSILATSGLGAIANVTRDNKDISNLKENVTQEQIAQESQNKLQQLLTNTATPTDTTDTDDRDRFLTIAQLGGVIGAARNPSELSAGIGQLAGNIQKQRRGEDMRQAELQLKQAQIAQVQSAIENLPIEQLNETYNAIIEGINAGQLDAEEYGPTLNSIVQRLMALQNIDLQDNTSILQETRVS